MAFSCMHDETAPQLALGSSSSRSPSPVGACRRFSCDICGVIGQGKYTCPACGVHTCSLHCQKHHKSNSGCSGVRSRCDFVCAEDMNLKTISRCITPLQGFVLFLSFSCWGTRCMLWTSTYCFFQRLAIFARCSCRARQGRSHPR
jgi:hypothetical protein